MTKNYKNLGVKGLRLFWKSYKKALVESSWRNHKKNLGRHPEGIPGLICKKWEKSMMEIFVEVPEGSKRNPQKKYMKKNTGETPKRKNSRLKSLRKSLENSRKKKKNWKNRWRYLGRNLWRNPERNTSWKPCKNHLQKPWKNFYKILGELPNGFLWEINKVIPGEIQEGSPKRRIHQWTPEGIPEIMQEGVLVEVLKEIPEEIRGSQKKSNSNFGRNPCRIPKYFLRTISERTWKKKSWEVSMKKSQGKKTRKNPGNSRIIRGITWKNFRKESMKEFLEEF